MVWKNLQRQRGQTAFTLVEVVISVIIIAAVFGGVIVGYTQTARRAQWSGFQLAAQALAIQQLEQVRAARWELGGTATTNIDQTYNLGLMGSNKVNGTDTNTWELTGYSTNILDVPYSGPNYIYATNYVRVSSKAVSGATNVYFRMVRVDTVWPFSWKSETNYMTNTLCTICAPDN
jgi:type II secretory pathway pseudopilin PulG